MILCFKRFSPPLFDDKGIIPQKGSDCMSEKEKRVVEKLRDAIPNMTDFQKGYVLGMVESSASKHSEQEEEKDERRKS